MITWAYINDQFTSEEKALLHVRDISILRSYAVFDFFSFQNYQPLFIDDHLARLNSSTSALGLTLEKTNDELKRLVQELIIRNAIKDGGIRITVTGGISENGYDPSLPALIITQHSFDVPSTEKFSKGLDLLSYDYQRQLPHIKTTDYIMGIHLQPWLKQQNANDVLYMNKRIISECPRSNIFIIDRQGQLCTPATGILQGITRKKIIELAPQGLKVVEKDISIDDVFLAREAFITSTTKKIFPVRSLDKKQIGNGQFTVAANFLQLYHQVSAVPAAF